jgi:transposase InsO family protein
MRFEFIAAEKANYPIRLMCRVLQVSRGGFYAWLKRPAAAHSFKDQRLAVEIAAIYQEHRGRYGSPRVHVELRDRGYRTGRKRVARLMREQSLRARHRRRYRTTTDSRHGLPISPNVLARQFIAAAPNRAWVTDITYIWTVEGWLYLAVMLDLFSRRVVGFALSDRIDLQLARDALMMAIGQRQPALGLLHHSDRGSQYASYRYQQMLDEHDMVCSMSRRGDCWDNAVAESFFATLKVELVYRSQWRSRAQACTAIFEYIELYYNRRRKHSALGYRSPVEFEDRMEHFAERTQNRAEFLLNKKDQDKPTNQRHIAA